MIIWSLYQYKKVIDAFISQCDIQTQNKIYQQLDLLRQQGNRLRMPVCKPLTNTNGLYELRPKKARLIFYFDIIKNEVIFVYAYHKPVRNKYHQQAQKNRQTILLEEAKLNVIN